MIAYTVDSPPAEPLRSQIIAFLIESRKAGIFQAVWIDADVIHTRQTIHDDPLRLTWKHAEELMRGNLE